jgi:hypothetical protein
MWPDEAYGSLFDSVAWEASLSRCGIWSAVVNTAHISRPAMISSIESMQYPGVGETASLPDRDGWSRGEDARQIAQLLNRKPLV